MNAGVLELIDDALAADAEVCMIGATCSAPDESIISAAMFQLGKSPPLVAIILCYIAVSVSVCTQDCRQHCMECQDCPLAVLISLDHHITASQLMDLT
jgi:hypothetical protein